MCVCVYIWSWDIMIITVRYRKYLHDFRCVITREQWKSIKKCDSKSTNRIFKLISSKILVELTMLANVSISQTNTALVVPFVLPTFLFSPYMFRLFSSRFTSEPRYKRRDGRSVLDETIT